MPLGEEQRQGASLLQADRGLGCGPRVEMANGLNCEADLGTLY